MNPYRLYNLMLIETDFPNVQGGMWVYVAFNFVEALAWHAFAIFVLYRFLRRRKTRVELLYAFSFLLFGLSDLIEMGGLSVGLLLFKGACIAAILAARQHVLHFYPGKKI